MTTIDIMDWEGTELLDEFIDYVATGTAEAKAIASQDTGAMVESVEVDPLSDGDGFLVHIDHTTVASISGKKEFYPYTYMFKGYPRYAPFNFLVEGFENISDEDSIGRKTIWRAKNSRGRRGSGTSRRTSRDRQALTAEKAKNRARYKARKFK